MLRASLGKVVFTVQRAGTFAAKVSPQELHKIAVHVRAVVSNYLSDFFFKILTNYVEPEQCLLQKILYGNTWVR